MQTLVWMLTISSVLFAVSASAQSLGPASDSAAAPGYSWFGDATTGIFRPSAGTVGIGTTGVERLRVNGTGVGIGTTSPARLLNVGGAIRLNPVPNPLSPAPGDIFVDSTASNSLKYHNGTSWVTIGSGSGDFLANGTVAMTGNLRLNNQWLSGDGGNEGVFVSSSGSVGIGTTSPTAQLHTSVAASNTIRVDSGAIGRIAQIHFNRGVGNDTYYGPTATNEFDVWSYENIPFRIGLNNLERVRIDTAGNVGIGTSSTSTRLHVSGNASEPIFGDINKRDRRQRD